jgi:superfamily I DNA and RNA helicase
MEFIISELKKDDIFIEKVIEELKRLLLDCEGFCYVRYPIFGVNRNIENPDFLIISRRFGIIIIDVFDFHIEKIKEIKESRWCFNDWDWKERELLEEGEDKLYAISGRISVNRALRKFSGGDNRIKGKYFVYLHNVLRNSWEIKFAGKPLDKLIFQNELSKFIEEQKSLFKSHLNIPDNIWTDLIGLFSGSPVLSKPVRKQESEKTKAGITRKIENQICILDLEQMKVGQQIPPGPQRIRGLAGTGKTIVLAMKAAHMHLQHPEWNIVYTFNTQSLYGYSRELIKRFYQYWSEGHEPNWDKLKILHGWGGKEREGLYSYVSKLQKIPPKTFKEAKNFFEHKKNSELLGKCCADLMSKSNLPKLFDAILIDEAQDFHKDFFQFCFKILKAPKRLVWAYDELQSLEDMTIPTAKDIFGVDENGIPLVDLDGVYPGGIEKDFILYKSYRTPRSILMTAHVFGMGLLRGEGALQFIPNREGWEDLGYKFVDGNFEVGQIVTVTRPVENSPNAIEDYVEPKNLIRIKVFKDKNEELEWIANEISNDINREKLQPEDILIIGIGDKNLYNHFKYLKSSLNKKNINSFIVGEGIERSVFRTPNFVTISTVFKAKGNEASSVYVFNFENSEDRNEITQARNMAFTSISRTKGWVAITGVGKLMEQLKDEINTILSQYPNVQFRVPDIHQIKRYLDNIEYEKRRVRIKKSEMQLMEAIKKIESAKGEEDLSKEAKKKIKELAKKFEKGGVDDYGK